MVTNPTVSAPRNTLMPKSMNASTTVGLLRAASARVTVLSPSASCPAAGDQFVEHVKAMK